MTEHDLKCWPEVFEDTIKGRKAFEVRKDDRNFAVGDTLLLREWSPQSKEYTGREHSRRVKYILSGGQFGIEKGYVVMATVRAKP